ncbi:MAG: RagB/SusD family nutrient uptake outer membrane protein [Cyclobacteriaceae bacterium]
MLKFRYNLTPLFVLMLSMGGCHDDLLNPVPESILTNANAFENANDIDLAVLGVYNRLQSRVPTDYELMEIPSDNMYGYYFATAPGMAEIGLLDVSPENPKINSFWKDTYNGIFRANTVLANVDGPIDYTQELKDQHIGEAKFLRAYYYFDLVRLFGGVPEITGIIEVEDSRQTPRATEEAIFDLIIADLTDAASKLPVPGDTDHGRASKGAAIALLAKVYVYQEDWTAAKTQLDRLFSDFNYGLLPNYGDLFEIETEVNEEAIFSLAYVGGTNGHGLTYSLAPTAGIYGVINGGSRVGRPTWDLHRAFEEGDSRFEVTITEMQLTYASDPDDEPFWFPYFNKYIIPAEISNNSGLDLPILRLGDMILLHSEVLYQLGDAENALGELNRIRERAFGNDDHNYGLEDISTPELFMDKLLLERRLELAVENNRWFDLVRTNRFTDVLTQLESEYNPSTGNAVVLDLDAQPYMRHFPIPYEQIQLAAPDVMVQNDGY